MAADQDKLAKSLEEVKVEVGALRSEVGGLRTSVDELCVVLRGDKPLGEGGLVHEFHEDRRKLKVVEDRVVALEAPGKAVRAEGLRAGFSLLAGVIAALAGFLGSLLYAAIGRREGP